MSPEMSEREREIAEHALAWPVQYRNYFAAEHGSPDYKTLEGMVGSGWATVGPRIPGGLVVFYMTDQTIEALRTPTEEDDG